MPEFVIEFDHIFKKFARGERHTSLRDFIPAMTKKLLRFGRDTHDPKALGAQEFWAVNDVSFRLRRGDTMGIIGPNGSGKSTTLKLLSGILRPDLGRYHVHGRLSALIEVGAGFHPDLTGRENVFLNGSILGMTRKEVQAKFADIVEFAGVEQFIDTPVKRYSSGMAVRLGFAVAAFIEPDVLLVDEVLAVGDTEFRSRCHNRMERMHRNGVSMILVSHNLNEVRNLCDTTLMLYKGQPLMHGPTQKVIEEYHRTVVERIKIEQEKQETIDRKEKESTTVELTGAQTLNDEGEPVETFGTGDSMTVRIHYRANKRLEKPQIVAETVWATEDFLATVFNTKNDDMQLAPLEGTGYIDLRIKAMLIEPNVYSMKIQLIDGATGLPVDALPRVRFVLSEQMLIPGVFALEHGWSQSEPAPIAPAMEIKVQQKTAV